MKDTLERKRQRKPKTKIENDTQALGPPFPFRHETGPNFCVFSFPGDFRVEENERERKEKKQFQRSWRGHTQGRTHVYQIACPIAGDL
jgi:hypothetical protein